MIVRPVGISLRDWADQLTLDLNVQRLDGPDWQPWGASISVVYSIPNPYGFADWREWADRVCNALENGE